MENIDVYAKCPHCNVELEYHDQLSVDYDDIYYFVNWSAFCPQHRSAKKDRLQAAQRQETNLSDP